MGRRFILFISLIFVILIPLVILGSKIFHSQWDGSRRFTIILSRSLDGDSKEGSAFFILSLEPLDHRVVLLRIPGNTLLDVPYGYKTYPAASVYGLGQLDPKRGGGNLVRRAIESTFGISVDGFFLYSSNFWRLPETSDIDISRFKSEFSLLKYFTFLPRFIFDNRNVQTNLSLVDRYRIFASLHSLRADQIRVLVGDEKNILTSQSLPDGTVFENLNSDALDILITDSFQDARVRKELYTVEVANAAREPRLASDFSKILKHMGANVILTSTADNFFNGRCKIESTKTILHSSILIERLNGLYNCDSQELTGSSNMTDIRLILGSQFVL